MNNSASSFSSLTYLTNPLKEDPELKSLFKELETTVASKQDFELWRNSFLSRFIEFLDVDSTERAEQAYWKFSDTMSTFVRVINKLNKHMDDGNISSSHCSVKARQCLQEVSRHITIVVDEVDNLLPGTMNMEKKVGFTKFHIGAVLVRDGFREYARLSMCADVIEKMEKALKDVADKLILLNMNLFICKLNAFCDVMADLGLLSALLKCSEYVSADDDEEQIRLSSMMQDAGQDNDKINAYETFDPDSSITLFDRSNPILNYEEEVSAPDPAEISNEVPPNEKSTYPTFDPETSITVFDRSNGSLHSTEREINHLPVEFAPREPAPYGHVSPTKQSSLVKVHPSKLPKPPMDSGESVPLGKTTPRGNQFAPREPAPYGYESPSKQSASVKVNTSTLPRPPMDSSESEPHVKTSTRGNQFAPREPAPYGYESPSKQPASVKVNTSTMPKPPMNFSQDVPNKTHATEKGRPLRWTKKTDASKPPTVPKPPLMKQVSSASAASTITQNSDTKPTGRVRWNPAQYYNTKKKPENTANKDKPLVNEKNAEVEESKIKSDQKEEPEKKGLRSLFHRKPSTKPAPSAVTEEKPTSSVKSTIAPATEPSDIHVEDNEIAEPDADEDDDKPIQRRQKWSLNDFYNRISKKKERNEEKRPKKRKDNRKSANETPNATTNSNATASKAADVSSQDTDLPLDDSSLADDVSESSTMISDNEEPIKQVNSNKNVEKSTQAVVTDSQANDKHQKKESTSAAKPKQPEKNSNKSKPSEKDTNTSKKPEKETKQPEKTSNTSKPSEEHTNTSKKPEKATKQPEKNSDTSKPCEKDTNTSKKPEKATKLQKQPESTSSSTPQQAKQPLNTTKEPDAQSQSSTKQEMNKDNAPTNPSAKSKRKPKNQPVAVQEESSNTSPPDRPVKDHKKKADKASSATKSSINETNSKKSLDKNAEAGTNNNPQKNNEPQSKAAQAAPDSKHTPPVKSSTVEAPAANGKNQETQPKKSQVEKKALKKERNSAKDEKGSGESKEGLPEKKSSKKDTAKPPSGDMPKKGIKKLFNRPNKKNQPDSQSGENASTVSRSDETPQQKPWDGVSSTSKNKSPWDESYETKKKNANGNEPLAICAAPPEDDDNHGLGKGGAPLLAICAAEPEPEEYVGGGGGKPLLAICAAETSDDDENDADAVSLDDVSESETMASDDENVDDVSENETIELDDDVKDAEEGEHNSVDGAEPCVDDVSDSETVVSGADDDFNNNNDVDLDELISMIAEEENVDETTSGAQRSYLDDVSESETANSNVGDGNIVEEMVPTTTTETSNQSIAPTGRSNEYEKSDSIAVPQSTLDTTTSKVVPEKEKKKEAKVLSDEERRKCYMWYDRMGRPNRDKMKQRIINGMKDCDITVDDVDALPWMMRGAMISQSELNKLILK